MNERRSYLDTLNAGRQRRQYASLDELNRSLETLERSIGRNRRASEEAQPDSAAPAARRSATPKQEPARDHMETQASIAAELKSLRDELRVQMTSSLQREFDALRQDIERAVDGGGFAGRGGELSAEFQRLSDAIKSLAERSDDRGIALLRQELEQIRNALDALPSEESLRAADRRWEDFDRRWTEFEQDRSHREKPAIALINERVAEIGKAVASLPEPGVLTALEEKVRTLATAVERLSSQQEGTPAAFAAVEQRLDEISRAVLASTVAAQSVSLDTESVKRLEARITALAHQIEDIAEERSHHQVIERLNALSQRVDSMAERAEFPDEVAQRLGRQLAVIQQKLDSAPPAIDADQLMEGIDRRFDQMSGAIERSHGEVFEQATGLFRDLERRLEEVAARLEERPGAEAEAARLMETIDARLAEFAVRLESRRADPVSERAIRGLEARLEEISLWIDSSGQHANRDSSAIRSLQNQVTTLSERLSNPVLYSGDMQDLGPRLDELERSISGSREAMLEAAREAAEKAVQAFSASDRDSEAIADLAGDLKTLDALSRRSDERNTRTFEAIHDTLLKIVDRLGTLEGAISSAPAAADVQRDEPRRMVGETPSIDPERAPAPQDPAAPQARAPERSPAEAAAEAAAAAAGGDIEKPVEAPPKGSMLSGLTRAFRRKPATDAPQAAAAEATGTSGPAPQVELDEPLDPKSANRPLAPGSGAPDLNAIMRRVRDERSRTDRADSDAGRSDFIAAARRAAQAAASEAEAAKRAGSASGPIKSSPLSGLFGKGRKPMLLAATAIVVALGALQLGQAYMADEAEQASAEPAPLVAEQMPPAADIETQAERAPDEVAATAPEEERDAAAPVRMAEQEPAAADPAAQAPAIDSAAQARTTTAAADAPTPALPAAAEPAPMQVAAQTIAVPAAADAASEQGPDLPLAAEPEATAALTRPADPLPAAIAGPEAAAGGQPQAAVTVPAEAGPLPLREAAQAGDAKALFEIGARYAEGRGVAVDLAAAATWYEAAADLGFAPAQYRVGNLSEKGLGVPRDVAKAKTWYQLAANQGNASAMHNLAVLFAMGADGTTDNESAARWFGQAAELGVRDSQFNLGILAAKGVGMPQNLEESYKWFALVAKTGDSDAAAKRDEVANSLKPDQLVRARAAVELWKAKPLNPEANSVEIPESWQDDAQVTASIDMTKAIRNVQAILNKNGYEAGNPDGVMGSRTRAAIVAFQKDNGMEADGEIDNQLVEALLAKN